MTFSLNTIRRKLVQHRFLIGAALIVVLLLTVITVQQITRVSKPTYSPPPASQQPLVNGKLDTSSLSVQQSKNGLDILKPKLPFNQKSTTSTGTKVSFSVFSKLPDDPYGLYVSIDGIDFNIQKSADNYAQTVEDFRETADKVFGFIAQNGVDPSTMYISWASLLPNQKTAELWLNPSAEFPKVIKQNGKYIFESNK